MKKVLDLLMISFAITGISMTCFNQIFGSYKNDIYLFGYFLPIIFILMGVVTLFYYFHKDFLKPDWTGQPKVKLYLLSLAPYIAFFIKVFRDDLLMVDYKFLGFIFFVTSLIILEELVFRRILFIELIKIYGEKKSIFVGSAIFSMFSIVTLFMGATFFQMLMIMALSFIVGMIYTSTYLYTKKLSLVIIKSCLWRYISLSDMDIPLWLITTILVLETILFLNIVTSQRLEDEKVYHVR